jgi:hypothetical protein
VGSGGAGGAGGAVPTPAEDRYWVVSRRALEEHWGEIKPEMAEGIMRTLGKMLDDMGKLVLERDLHVLPMAAAILQRYFSRASFVVPEAVRAVRGGEVGAARRPRGAARAGGGRHCWRAGIRDRGAPAGRQGV